MMKNATSVRKLNVSNNRIAELFELNNFRGITTLTDVNLTGNPVTLVPGYRPILIDCTLNIDCLDLIQVDAQEKVSSSEAFRRQKAYLGCNLEGGHKHSRGSFGYLLVFLDSFKFCLLTGLTFMCDSTLELANVVEELKCSSYIGCDHSLR